MHQKQIITAGRPLEEAERALIMVHGRGSSADDILSLAKYLHTSDCALIAPQATNHMWYPYTFLAPPAENEPWLGSAIDLLKSIRDDLSAAGFSTDRMYWLGFSQGACRTLEFVTRYATRYGGVVAFTGGLIGNKVYRENYSGHFAGTPVFLGTSDPDPHVPLQRVEETAAVLTEMGAAVTKKVYKHMGHSINQDEIDTVNILVFERSGMHHG